MFVCEIYLHTHNFFKTFISSRQSLFEEAAKYFDPETGVLEAPMTIRVADQVSICGYFTVFDRLFVSKLGLCYLAVSLK